ncbi:MAG: iron hydrogenase small subunit, partial [Chitinispirillaceae bacterium]|nr:iron hydrogenase small subunit [Chitinispirillaceae bacterium]
VMEAALRTVIELVTGEKVENFFENAEILPLRGFDGCRIAELKIPDQVGKVPLLLSHLFKDWEWIKGAVLRVGVAHGISNAKKVMEDIKKKGVFSTCHFIEFMACPGGCLGGGGQPIPVDPLTRKKRAEAIYKEDRHYGEKQKPRKSHENPAVLSIYKKFLIEGPCGKTSHHYLHTSYINRKVKF